MNVLVVISLVLILYWFSIHSKPKEKTEKEETTVPDTKVQLEEDPQVKIARERAIQKQHLRTRKRIQEIRVMADNGEGVGTI